MKRLVIALVVLFASGEMLAQTNDSTKVEKEKVVQRDTIPTPSKEETESEKPRIIYYQSTDTDRKKERRQDIKTLSGSMSHSGGFGALSFRSSEFRNEPIVLAGIRGGWIINRTLGIGVEGHGIIPTAKFDDIDMNMNGNLADDPEVNILGGYGGMFLELIFFSNQVVHITFPVSAGAGWLGYQQIEEDKTMPTPVETEVDGDVFWYVEPGADLEFNVSRNFRLAFGVSKRFTQDLELLNTETDAFDKLNYFITLKVGGF